VSWDGEVVEPGRGLPAQKPGAHIIRLEKPGAAPITQTVEVRAGEPTVIRAR
jgi:hypothetical protein